MPEVKLVSSIFVTSTVDPAFPAVEPMSSPNEPLVDVDDPEPEIVELLLELDELVSEPKEDPEEPVEILATSDDPNKTASAEVGMLLISLAGKTGGGGGISPGPNGSSPPKNK